MLEITKSINLSGESKIDGVVVERYTAFINESNPGNPSTSRRVVDQDLYDANKATCRADQDVFDDTVDDMVKEAKEEMARKTVPVEEDNAEEAEVTE